MSESGASQSAFIIRHPAPSQTEPIADDDRGNLVSGRTRLRMGRQAIVNTEAEREGEREAQVEMEGERGVTSVKVARLGEGGGGRSRVLIR